MGDERIVEYLIEKIYNGTISDYEYGVYLRYCQYGYIDMDTEYIEDLIEEYHEVYWGSDY